MRLLPALDRNGVRVVEGDVIVTTWDNPLGFVTAKVQKVDGVMLTILITHEKGLPIQQSRWPHHVESKDWIVLR